MNAHKKYTKEELIKLAKSGGLAWAKMNEKELHSMLVDQGMIAEIGSLPDMSNDPRKRPLVRGPERKEEESMSELGPEFKEKLEKALKKSSRVPETRKGYHDRLEKEKVLQEAREKLKSLFKKEEKAEGAEVYEGESINRTVTLSRLTKGLFEPNKEVAMSKKRGRIIGDRVVGSEMILSEGWEAIPYYQIGDNGNKTLKLSLVKRDNIPLGRNTYAYKLVKEGKLTPIIVKLIDQSIKTEVACLLVDEVRRLTEGKGKTLKIPVAKKPERDECVYYIGERATFKEWFKEEKDLIKLIGYDTPLAIELEESDEEFTCLVIDTEKWALRLLTDGQFFCKKDIAYYTYLSDKDRSEGYRAKLHKLREFQVRFFAPLTGKGRVLLDSASLHDIAISWGFDPEKYDIVVDVANLKTNPKNLQHGDTFMLKVNDLRIVNILSEDYAKGKGGSSAGVQLTCADQGPTYELFKELNGPLKGRMWSRACHMEMEGLKWLLGLDKKKTMEDSDIINLKTLAMARKIGDYWIAPRTNATRQVINARLYTAWFEDVLKYGTAKYRPYIAPCPIHLTKDLNGEWTTLSRLGQDKLPEVKGRIDCALSIFEREHFEKTGERVNFVVLPDLNGFLKHWDEFKFHNGARAPIVSIESAQGIQMLPKEYVDRLHEFGFKSIYINGEHTVHSSTDSIMISQSFAKCLNADFDGDCMDLLLSMVAEYKAIRPKYPVLLASSKAVLPETDEELIAWLKTKFEITIMSADDIGTVDLGARLIIESYRMEGLEMPDDKKSALGLIRELLIQLKKHPQGMASIAKLIGFKGQGIITGQDVVKYLVRQYAYNGKVPKAHEAPITFKLKTKGLGLAVEDRWLDNQIEQIIQLSKTSTMLSYTKYDANRDVYAEAAKGKNVKVHADSEWWRIKFTEMWNKISAGDSSIIGIKVSKPTRDKIIAFGKDATAKYRAGARVNIKIKDKKEKMKAFGELKVAFMDQLSAFLVKTVGHDDLNRYKLRMAIAIYLGTISFGLVRGRDSEEMVSLPGYCFFYMGRDVVEDLCRMVNPDNPYLQK